MGVERYLDDAIRKLEQNRVFLDRTSEMLRRLRESLNETRDLNDVTRSLKASQKHFAERVSEAK